MTLRRSLILFAISLVVLAASVAGSRGVRGFGEPDAARSGVGAGAPSNAGDPLGIGPSDWLEIATPDVEFRTLDGSTARLSDHAGEVVILNFWGTWCPPCRVEIPHLVEAQTRLQEYGGTIIAPAVGSGSPDDIRSFAEEFGINYPIWIVSDAVAVERFAAPGYPFTMLIGPDGIIRRTYVGPQTEDTLLRDVEALLEGQAGETPAG